MKFITVPTKLIKYSDVENSELLGKKDEDWYDGFSAINVEDIEYICDAEECCSVYMKSGSSLEVLLKLSELTDLLNNQPKEGKNDREARIL